MILATTSHLVLFATETLAHADNYDKFAEQAVHRLIRQNAILERTYHISSYKHFHWSQDDRTLSFSTNGRVYLIANMQFVGDVSKLSHTWLWAWANLSVDADLTMSSKTVQCYGQKMGYRRLTTAEWPADQRDGWEMTAITAELTHAVGAYRTPDRNGYQFIVITSIRRVQP